MSPNEEPGSPREAALAEAFGRESARSAERARRGCILAAAGVLMLLALILLVAWWFFYRHV